ncbi:4-hydroxybenzoate octaprenyltransferase [Rickettsia endosymbiont of Halotydeus destructor]|uniref:4-hydroxybenzoate octaprenyltransferase n=1 Tax=Rickettsia endosymbiont of Halotydeus destructor TaxID=2996754 RepID=UPI003BAEB2D1
MPNKFFLALKLMRLNSPTGYLLVFFPALFGILLAKPTIVELIKLVSIFFLGSVITRSAGCIINDIFDKNFDKHIARTKERPLANGSLTVKDALLLLIILLISSLLILLSLNKTAIYIGFLAFIMIILYPLMKRFTHFPQIFLGFTFNIGILIGYTAVTNTVTLAAFIMYLACCSWTVGYDTIYGFMDLVDDKKIGVKSLSIYLENRHYKFWLYSFYIIFILLFILSTNIANYNVDHLPILAALILLILQVGTLNIYNPANCLIRFKANNYVGLILSLSLLY